MSRRRKPQPPRRRPVDPEQRDAAVWVESAVTLDGTYVVEVHSSGDWSTILDRDRALAYAATAHDAAARAEYDAAVVAQLTSIGVEMEHAAGLLTDLRNDRPELDDKTTAPLRFVPGVSPALKPFVHVYLHETEPMAQWSPAALRSHARNVLDVLATVDLDAAYRRALVSLVGLDDGRARAVVATLGEHRRKEK